MPRVWLKQRFPTKVLIAQVVFLLEHRQTDTQTQLSLPPAWDNKTSNVGDAFIRWFW